MSSILNSPIQLRLPELPQSELPPAVRDAIEELYVAIQTMQRAFQEQCGVGGWPVTQWNQVTFAQSLIAANANRAYMQASEAIGLGSVINVWNDAGTLKARNANATNNSRFAVGYCSVPGGVASGAFGEFILTAGLMPITGATPGTRYFLSTTNGLITNVAPGAAGNIRQYVGTALSATQLLYFNGGDFVQL